MEGHNGACKPSEVRRIGFFTERGSDRHRRVRSAHIEQRAYLFDQGVAEGSAGTQRLGKHVAAGPVRFGLLLWPVRCASTVVTSVPNGDQRPANLRREVSTGQSAGDSRHEAPRLISASFTARRGSGAG
jgi:hypothetical protein